MKYQKEFHFKNRDRDEFCFIALQKMITRKKQLQKIEIRSFATLELQTASLLFEKTKSRTFTRA